MTKFCVLPVETQLASRLRAQTTDDFGNPTRRSQAADRGAPCRHCLHDAAPGDELILTGHSPFDQRGPYKEVGPIFLHAAGCPAYASPTVIPPVVRRRLVTIRAYDESQSIVDADVVDGADAESLIERLFADTRTRYLHARTARFGCFLCRIERAEAIS